MANASAHSLFRFPHLILVALMVLTGWAALSACKRDTPHHIRKFHRKSVGKSAFDLLSGRDYNSVVVEIQYMTGFKPTPQAVTQLTSLMSARLNKDEGVTVVYTEIAPQGKSSYSLDDVSHIEDDQRTHFTWKKQIAVYFLFLDGEYVENTADSKVLGIAYYNTSMVIFGKTIQDLSGGIGQPQRYMLEATVINHEFGHILGLVNLGSTMQASHQDAPHGQHCTNQNCLMYWEAETGSAVTNLLGTNAIPQFDASCISDLQANGGK